MKKKDKIFGELRQKFIKKCVLEGIFPVATLRYDSSGISPRLQYVELDKKQQKEMLSSLNKQK